MSSRPPRAARRPRTRSIVGVTAALVLGLGHLSLAAAGPAAATTVRSVTVNPGATASVPDGPSFRDGWSTVAFTVPSTSARPLTVSALLRGANGPDGYRSRVVVAANGSMTLQLTRTTNGTVTVLTSRALGTVASGHKVTVQGWVRGDSSVLARGRAWVDANPKPDWQLSSTDTSSSRLTTAAVARGNATLASTATSSATLQLTTTGTPEATSTTTTPTTPTTPTLSGKGVRLTASQVGVPSGTSLQQHWGDIVVTQAGTVLSNLDVHGFVVVKAPNVRITRSIVRGGVAKYHGGLITSVGQPGLVVEDVDLVPAYPSVLTDGILGNNFTLRRVHVQGGVDSVKIEGDNVRVESSLLEKLNYYEHDPSQNNGPTHNDNVQVLTGRNIVITGTTALNTTNFPILGAAEWGHASMTVTNNYVDGGHCNMKFAVRNGWTLSAVVQNNTFGPHIIERTCPLVAEKAVNFSASGNVSEVSGAPIVPLRI